MLRGPYGREFARGNGRRGPRTRYGRRPPRRWEGGTQPMDRRPRAPPRGRRYWEEQQWMWAEQAAQRTRTLTTVGLILGTLVVIGVVVGVVVGLTTDDGNGNTATAVTTTEAPILCTETPEVTNGNVVVSGNTATYSCNACYGLLGSETRTCQNGIWGGSSPRCIGCGCAGVSPDLSSGARKKRQTDRIVGGGNAVEHSWPWQVGLKGSGTTIGCGGSLLSESWIVTSAHCFYDEGIRDNSLSRAVLGEHDQDTSSVKEQEVAFQPSDIFIHGGYSPTGSNDNDIALIKIQPRTLSRDSIWPVCLPTRRSFTQGEDAWATGWGATNNAGSLSVILQQVKLNINTYDDCGNYVGLTSNMICAGVTSGTKDSCQGDSGGPLVVQRSGTWYLAGVTSFGAGTCGDPDFPGVYARVSQLQSWLQTTMANNGQA